MSTPLPSFAPSAAYDDAPGPTLVRPETRRLNGAVREAYVPPFAPPVTHGSLADLPFGALPEAVLSASSGQFSYVFTEPVPNGVPGHWRAQFDFTPAGPGPVDMRLYLKRGDTALTETWLYQYHPLRA